MGRKCPASSGGGRRKKRPAAGLSARDCNARPMAAAHEKSCVGDEVAKKFGDTWYYGKVCSESFSTGAKGKGAISVWCIKFEDGDRLGGTLRM